MKQIILVSLAVMLTLNGFCQDQIIKKDKSEFKAKVLEITKAEVKYKKWENLGGPTYSLDKAEIFMIIYKNGSKDVFGEQDKENIELSNIEIKATKSIKNELKETNDEQKISPIKKQEGDKFKETLISYIINDFDDQRLQESLKKMNYLFIKQYFLKDGNGDVLEYNNLTIEYLNTNPNEIWIRTKNEIEFKKISELLNSSPENIYTPNGENYTIAFKTNIPRKEPLKPKLNIDYVTNNANLNSQEGYKKAAMELEKFKDELSGSLIGNLGHYYERLNDYENAKANYELGVLKNDDNSIYHLAMLYFKPQNKSAEYNKAYVYFKKIPKEYIKYYEAQYNLAVCIEKGELGANGNINYSEAVEYLKTSANLGYNLSCRKLGTYYYNSDKIEKNWVTSKYWFEKGCNLNDETSCEYFTFLKNALAKEGAIENGNQSQSKVRTKSINHTEVVQTKSEVTNENKTEVKSNPFSETQTNKQTFVEKTEVRVEPKKNYEKKEEKFTENKVPIKNPNNELEIAKIENENANTTAKVKTDNTIVKDYTIGLLNIVDKTTNTNKSFALFELFTEKNYTDINQKSLTPVFVDYAFNNAIGIAGTFNENNVSLTIYKEGKLSETIECENDWKTIIQKFDEVFLSFGYTTKSKLSKIEEGKSYKVYEKKIANNFPGELEIELPKNVYSDNFVNLGKYSYFEPKNAFEELKELHGHYGDADIKNTKFFKFKDVPENLKQAVKPIVWPIGKTVILPVNYIMYGNYFIEQKNYPAAQHCYFQAIENTTELIGSVKDKANIRAFAFEKLAFIQTKISSKRVLFTELYKTCAAMNKHASLGEAIIKEHVSYYTNINQIKQICIKAEDNAKTARASRFSLISGAITNGVAQGFATSGMDMSSISSTIDMNNTIIEKAKDQLIANNEFKMELSDIAGKIQGDAFTSSSNGIDNIGYKMANEAMYFLSQYPLDVKDDLEAYAEDKPILKNLLEEFYLATSKPIISKTLKKIYFQLSKIESAIANFEVRNMEVSNKYLNSF